MPKADIETERLRLRLLTLGDADAIFAVIGDPLAMQYYPRTFAMEDAVDWIERNLRRYESDGCGMLAVVLKSSGDVIGDCGLAKQMVEGELMLEVGYHLRRDHWGHGYATEAARECMDRAFRELGAERVVSLIRPENLPSRAVADRNGMQVTREVMHDGMRHLLYTRFRAELNTGDPSDK